jgi:c-di-GMP-binding flagellar brake protein YcgR
MSDRDESREFLRASINVFVNEDIASNTQMVRALDISEAGMRYMKPAGAFHRTSPKVYLEFCLPDEGEPIQALGRIVYDELDNVRHATSVSFEAIASEDSERIRRYVVKRKRAELFEMLRQEHLDTAMTAQEGY